MKEPETEAALFLNSKSLFVMAAHTFECAIRIDHRRARDHMHSAFFAIGSKWVSGNGPQWTRIGFAHVPPLAQAGALSALSHR
jgi:hypothetical protein